MTQILYIAFGINHGSSQVPRGIMRINHSLQGRQKPRARGILNPARLGQHPELYRMVHSAGASVIDRPACAPEARKPETSASQFIGGADNKSDAALERENEGDDR